MAVEWTVGARADLARVFEFNLTRSPAYAGRIDARLLERANAVELTPRMGRPVGGAGLRALSVVDVQCVITYAIIGGRVTVVGVRHTRENRESA